MPRPRKSIEEDRWRVPAPAKLDRDLVREYRCFMCGRDAPDPRPRSCPTCGGNWLMTEEYVFRYV